MTVNRSDLTLSEADRRELIGWTVSSVRRLLRIFKVAAPDDGRLLAALEGAEAVARACGQAVAVAHMAGHSREVARYTRRALGTDSSSELEWQRANIPVRFRAYVYDET